MRFLTEAERQHLRERLAQHGASINVEADERGFEHDGHLVFEALHVLADGIPERLYALLHPASPKGLARTQTWEADPGRTLLFFRKIAEAGVGAVES
ncbi:hypothetical protein A5904_05790 [Acidithiobacillus caldus]|uniref:hypothetical protein n=1 Tax=Acidithiobacillus caldus TaxID=33059 RepID=UPI0007D9DE84|nr:hypothetical protein [Acidithiobacillus caldus]AUW32537.1 hypothetical protein A5904_05790 [Acidithiobacillus caldus]QER44795.1 hypothetical protein F0726_01731 [Acidithiobacillus caldus]